MGALLVFYGAWALVAIIGAGIIREVIGPKWYDHAALPAVIFAPLTLAAAVVVGVAWGLSWLGRLPARYIIARLSRPRLPPARVIE